MNNALRNKIGLTPIQKSWNKIQVNGIYDDLYVSKNNVIVKAISQNEENGYYSETDLEVQLNNQGKIVTKTGKMKNLTSSVYENIKPKDISVSIRGNEIRISNHSNNLMLIDEYDLDCKNLEEAFDFINEYLKDDQKYFVEHFERFKSAKKTSKQIIKSGDIFRIPIRGKQFVFGQVISPLRKMAKMELPVLGGFDTSDLKINVFDPNPFYFPLWVRFFIHKTDNPYLQEEHLKELKYTSSTIIGDYGLRHSNYSLVGNLDINISEIDMPMEVGTSYNYVPEFHYFNWGAGIITIKANKNIEKLISENALNYPNRLREREHKSIEVFIDYYKEGKQIFSGLHSTTDLRDDNLKKIKNVLFKKLGLDQPIDYDEFAIQNGFMSINKIIELNK
jgi:hypothetical protein